MATPVYGCMNPDALNYNPSATYSNASAYPCTPRVRGCTNSAAANYNALYNTLLPGSCIFLGCMNLRDTRYSPITTIDNGSCPNNPGCTEIAALNYNAVYNVQLAGSCSYGGCTDSTNANYDARNTFFIPGSCATSGRRLEKDAPGRRLQGPSCMDPAASTYSATATSHLQSACTYHVLGCTNVNAFNYLALATAGNPAATTSCIASVTGCMSPTALNYNSMANTAGTCTYPVQGCMNSAASNYMPTANVNVASLCTYIISGCTTPQALNYNPSATVDNGGCTFPVRGCQNPTATNYVAGVTAGFATTCVYNVPGCTLAAATNFNPNATVDNGSCVVASPPPKPPPPSPPAPPPPPSPSPPLTPPPQFPPSEPETPSPSPPQPISLETSGSMGIIIGAIAGVVIGLVLALVFVRRRCHLACRRNDKRRKNVTLQLKGSQPDDQKVAAASTVHVTAEWAVEMASSTVTAEWAVEMATPEPKLAVATEGGADSKLEHASGGDTSASMTSTGGHVSRLETEHI